jgi:RNA polymerase sigma-70 factor (ECF subfamily)
VTVTRPLLAPPELAPHRERLLAIARRMLGSSAEAEDVVQEVWLRARDMPDDVASPGAWLTTVTSRICLDHLRTRRRRPEVPLEVASLPPEHLAAADPADGAVRSEEVGAALLVVLDRLTPEQRVAFVLHDLFAVPFDEIAPLLDRTPDATKQLASRARRRILRPAGSTAVAPADVAVVEAFLVAARGGDLDALLQLLAPGAVRRLDPAGATAGPADLHGAAAVAEGTRRFAHLAARAELALVDDAPGIVVAVGGRLVAVLVVEVAGGRVQGYEVVMAPARLAAARIALLEPPAADPLV